MDIPDEELWAARQALRTFLSNFIRECAHTVDARACERGAIVAAATPFDQNTLTIGFARRFTSYKRSELIFSDPDRLARILTAPGRAVQIVFAGKAHPADEVGKHHLQQIFRRALDPKFGGRIGFVDDYDLHVAHFLVQGCDVWLNNPRQADGGQRHERHEGGHQRNAASVDRRRLVGRRIHRRERLAHRRACRPNDQGAQDWADAQALYSLIEEQLVPTFYERDSRGIPRRWLQIVKQSIRTVLPDSARAGW